MDDVTPPQNWLLSIRELRTSYFQDQGEVRAVDGVSFDISQGEVIGVVGESGCGKSVTARSILRMVEEPGKVIGGEIWLRSTTGDTTDLVKLDPKGKAMRAIRGREIALIFQEPMTSLSPVHTVGSQIVEAIRLYEGLSANAAADRAVELLRQVEMPNPTRRLNEYAFQLSGGLRQRAMIAIALAGNPRILIADEPTTALDVTTQAQILDLLRRLRNERGMALMMITHDLGMVAQVANRVIVMYLGKVVEDAPVDAIFHSPRHPYTRALLRSLPTMHGDSKTRLPTIPGSVPSPFETPPGCSFGPRCDSFVSGLCDSEVPTAIRTTNGYVRCHLTREESNGT